MVHFFIRTFKRYAWFKRLNARITYELLAKKIPATEWSFMNYGYMPNESEPKPDWSNVSMVQPYPLQMYHYLASKVDLKGKTVLEIGSGRGGGAGYIAEFFKPVFYTGLDLAQYAVNLANQNNSLPNLKFIQGSAEAIPLTNQSVDVVINVESSHAYGSVEKFLHEVWRVLTPGGYFLIADFRSDQQKLEEWKNQLHKCGLLLLEEEDITQNVVKAIEAEDASKRERIQRLIPAKWQDLFYEFAGVVGSRFYNTLKNGPRSYYRFVLRKKVDSVL
jgi:ubiquinone/menaquinone biosynthesis C-methylase UbiE